MILSDESVDRKIVVEWGRLIDTKVGKAQSFSRRAGIVGIVML